MRLKFCLIVSIIFCVFGLNAQVHKLSDISDINLSQGESLNIDEIVTGVKISGEDAEVTVNFSDTSKLAVGKHDLIFTAMSFSGKTNTQQVSLIIKENKPLVSEPTLNGAGDLVMVEGDRFNLLKKVSALSGSGKAIPVSVSIKYPEFLAAGSHDIYYTAVDYDGNSKVVSAKIQVNQLEMKYKKAEWAQLGEALYKKYFTPASFSNDVNSGISRYFTYSPTEEGISAEILINEIKYNTLDITGVYPGKLERLTARMVLLLNELKHHRIFWKDEKNIIFSLSETVRDATEYDFSHPDNTENPGAMKSRGVYIFKIPVDEFKKDNSMEIICNAFHQLSNSSADVEMRKDNGGKITKQHIKFANGGKIVYMQDLGSKLIANHNSNVEQGSETFEEDFDYNIFQNEWQLQYSNYLKGHFGTFTNPRLFFNEEGK
jgi:hypothetical protein